MGEKEEELLPKEGKGLDAEVKHCSFCGIEFAEADKTNNKILCECGVTFKVTKYS